MEDDLHRQIEAVEADPAVRHVVVVTHHQPFDEVVHHTGGLPWEYFNAFMGSTGLGEVIRRGTKVRAAIYGHTHVLGRKVVGGIPVYGTPLGYPHERERFTPGDDITQTRIGWLEL
jgi:Icc-related predicted phosphoesterase